MYQTTVQTKYPLQATALLPLARTLTDAELITAVRSGDESAFRELFERYRR